MLLLFLLVFQISEVSSELCNFVLGFVDKSVTATPFHPFLDITTSSSDFSFLSEDLNADRASLRIPIGIHHQFQPTSLPLSEFSRTMLGEISPPITAAGQSFLIVKAHLREELLCIRMSCLKYL